MSARQIDPSPYIRFPKLDASKALSLGRILVRRAPHTPSAPVRRALALVEASIVELNAKWKEPSVPLARKRDARPLARRLRSAWSAVRDRLLSYEAEPEDSPDRVRAASIHDMLFPQGLEFTLVAFASQHAGSQYRIEVIDERGLATDLARLVGANFLATLRSAHQALGDALGISKAVLPSVPVVLSEPLRALADAICRYALQLLAVASDNPDKRDEILVALSPIDEFRASAGRRITSADDDDAEEQDEVASGAVVTPLPVVPTPVVLAPVA